MLILARYYFDIFYAKEVRKTFDCCKISIRHIFQNNQKGKNLAFCKISIQHIFVEHLDIFAIDIFS